jgi:WD40 repeat protein
LATVAQDQTARVWDVATGQSVSPMLLLREAPVVASLASDGSRLIVRYRNGAGSVWDLTPDLRPVDDLVRLTQLLSGQAVDGPSGGLESVGMKSLRETWPKLRSRYPQEFTLSEP